MAPLKQLCRSKLERNSDVIHGLNAVAPLKPQTGSVEKRIDYVIHGLNAVAPLKPACALVVLSLRTTVIHGLNAVAPLKPGYGFFQETIGNRYPRPKRRGPIEAKTLG